MSGYKFKLRVLDMLCQLTFIIDVFQLFVYGDVSSYYLVILPSFVSIFFWFYMVSQPTVIIDVVYSSDLFMEMSLVSFFQS